VPQSDSRNAANASLIRSTQALLADLATDNITEQFPAVALEFPQLKLLDRSEVSCARVDRDARQEFFQLQTFDARCLLHDIRSGKIVAAFFEDMNHCLSITVSNQYILVLTITRSRSRKAGMIDLLDLVRVASFL
jgi:hypothetical protein